MTIEILQKDAVAARKSGDKKKVTALSNMIDAVQKASMTSKGRVAITEQLVGETLIQYQKVVQEQYDKCPESATDPKRDAELKQRRSEYLDELNFVKQYAPQLLTDYNEIKEAVVAILSEHDPIDALSSKSNKGTVMKLVAPAMKGKADMSIVNKVVGDLLA